MKSHNKSRVGCPHNDDMRKCLRNYWIMHYTHHDEEFFYFYNIIYSRIIEPIIVLFNNYLMTLQPNLPPRLWHDLIVYEPHSNFRMDNGRMVLWSQCTWHIAKCNTSACMAPMAFACRRTQTSWKKNPHNCKSGNH